MKAEVQDLMERVGLNPEHYNRYPNEFSGGQRQRIGIARAIALRPKLIVCDEPVSALDVSIQAQVVNLLEDLQDEFGLAYVFIAHDLSVVRHISDRVAVMYLGQIMEIADAREALRRPAAPVHPRAAVGRAVPDPTPSGTRERILLRATCPARSTRRPGCVFRTRCWKAQERCAERDPAAARAGARATGACHFPEEKNLIGARPDSTSSRRSRPRSSATGLQRCDAGRAQRAAEARRVASGSRRCGSS